MVFYFFQSKYLKITIKIIIKTERALYNKKISDLIEVEESWEEKK